MVPGASGGGVTHKQKVLRLLSDGKPHTHHELYSLGCVAHSRVADLRRDGHNIVCWGEISRGERVSVYQLCGSLDAAAAAPTAVTPPDPLPGRVMAAASSEPSNPGEAHEASDDRSASRDGGSLLLLFPENVSVHQQPLFAA